MEFKNLILGVIGRFLVASDRAGWGSKDWGGGGKIKITKQPLAKYEFQAFFGVQA